MKIFSSFILLFLFCFSYGQSFKASSIKYLQTVKSFDKRCDFVQKKYFIKENTEDNSFRFVRKRYNKAIQEFEEEVVVLIGDTISYGISNPKKYVKFKRQLFAFYKEVEDSETTQSVTVYKYRKKKVILREKDEEREDGKTIKLYYFTFFEEEK